MADRGLSAFWLYQLIVKAGGIHDYGYNHQGTYQPASRQDLALPSFYGSDSGMPITSPSPSITLPI
jgi:hypothetical protein